MAREILLYGSINRYSVEYFIYQLERYKNDSPFIRMNTPGGSVIDASGLIAKQKEVKAPIKVDGMAASMGALMLLYAESVEVLDITKVMFHRAAYGFIPNRDQKRLLDIVNNEARALMESKIDDDKFKEFTGYSIKDLFESDERPVAWLTGTQAYDLGIATNLVKITPEIEADIQARSVDFPHVLASFTPESKIKTIKMNIEELKTNHPNLYAETIAIGLSDGIKNERLRIKAWSKFNDIDAKAVEAGIYSGKEITQLDMADFVAKTTTPEYLLSLRSSNLEIPPAPDAIKAAEAAALEAKEKQFTEDLSYVKKKVFSKYNVKS